MLVKATPNKEASFTGRDGAAVLVKAGTVTGIRFNFGFGTVIRFADGTETEVSDPFPDVEKALGWDKSECAFKHDKVDRLFGVPFVPIERLPTRCTCGAPITYADTVMFFPEPPLPSEPGVLETVDVPIKFTKTHTLANLFPHLVKGLEKGFPPGKLATLAVGATPESEGKSFMVPGRTKGTLEATNIEIDNEALARALFRADPTRRLKDRLAEWQDWDGAAYELGVLLGLWPEWTDRDPGSDNWGGTKHIFWSANPIGEALHDALVLMVKAGILEMDEEETRFRWNPKEKE